MNRRKRWPRSWQDRGQDRLKNLSLVAFKIPPVDQSVKDFSAPKSKKLNGRKIADRSYFVNFFVRIDESIPAFGFCIFRLEHWLFLLVAFDLFDSYVGYIPLYCYCNIVVASSSKRDDIGGQYHD